MNSDEARHAVLIAARARARALVAGDRLRLTELLHPNLRWTTYRGTVLDRDRYVAGNTAGNPRWIDQQLDEVDIQIVNDTVAILTARITDVVDRDGLEETFRLRITQTWVRADGRWQCLSGHAGPRLH